MVLTVTLNPAIDKLLVLHNFEIHKLHRLEPDEMSLIGPGGKGVNIALNLKFLGDEVIATGFAGGHAGHLLCDGLRQQGITTSFVFAPGLTRTNISILDKENGTLTEINDFGQQVPSDDQYFLLENYSKLLHRVDFVVLAGSLPEGVPVEFYHKLIVLAKEAGVRVCLHTMPNHIDQLASVGPFAYHPDMRSFHQLLGHPCDGIGDFIAVGRELLDMNPETQYVLFTHRLENVVVTTRSKNYVLRPAGMNIVNMLGYNDAFIAGFIHGLINKLPEQEALIYASAAGLSNVEQIHKELRSMEIINKNINRIKVQTMQ